MQWVCIAHSFSAAGTPDSVSLSDHDMDDDQQQVRNFHAEFSICYGLYLEQLIWVVGKFLYYLEQGCSLGKDKQGFFSSQAGFFTQLHH